jgi:hypothetical protein
MYRELPALLSELQEIPSSMESSSDLSDDLSKETMKVVKILSGKILLISFSFFFLSFFSPLLEVKVWLKLSQE